MSRDGDGGNETREDDAGETHVDGIKLSDREM